MANSVKGDLIVLEAAGTDYSALTARRPVRVPLTEVTDCDFFHDLTVDAVETAGSLDLAELIPATVQGLIVHNYSTTATEIVTVTYGSQTATVGAEATFGIIGTDFDTTLTLVSASGTPKCRVVLWGK